MGWGVRDKKSGQNRKPDAFLKPQQKIKISTFFSIFGVQIFLGPKLDPGILAESKVPPTIRLGTSGPGGRRRKKWSKSKTRRVLEIATKNRKINFFFDFFGPDFFGPEIWQSRGWPAPLGAAQAKGGPHAGRENFISPSILRVTGPYIPLLPPKPWFRWV